MNQRIKNIIFDFDGTLVDTAPLIIATMQATITELGLSARTDEECRTTIGIRLEDVPDKLWPDNDSAAKFADTYRRIFEELKHQVAVNCFPAVLKTLDRMHRRGYRMAIASSRSRKSLEEYVERFGISEYFDMLVGGNDVANGKPAPDPVLKILHTCGWKVSNTITVGDAPVDILMGRAAGTLTCAVTYGNGKRDEIAATAPNFIIDSFDEILPIIAANS